MNISIGKTARFVSNKVVEVQNLFGNSKGVFINPFGLYSKFKDVHCLRIKQGTNIFVLPINKEVQLNENELQVGLDTSKLLFKEKSLSIETESYSKKVKELKIDCETITIQAKNIKFEVSDKTEIKGKSLVLDAEIEMKKKVSFEKEVNMKEKLEVEKEITSKEDVKAGNVSLKTHKHSTSQGPSGPPS